ncbi:hypothetical protein QEV83_00540 [Methylocapsa sp. D3K7]|uniref:hypothetical protein n=1 Tax=Methylocapsa sp. D3K7 TaxID=3041435 RepID=UPI00244EDD82|nr:hypothetical protein [Methylocapsa sp. D3K7]WGJ14846.1 hypothetical protein QEV83_00540 [Methylocapsa sp. D3K7]
MEAIKVSIKVLYKTFVLPKKLDLVALDTDPQRLYASAAPFPAKSQAFCPCLSQSPALDRHIAAGQTDKSECYDN